jgi:hypothetical protein
MRQRTALARAALAGSAVALLAGACSAPAGTGAAQRTAREAVRAASDQDSATLCSLLSPATVHRLEEQQQGPCATVARSLDLGNPAATGRAQVWGSSALVPVGSSAVFLTDVDGRWRVLAAGCTVHEDEPADCRLGGS